MPQKLAILVGANPRVFVSGPTVRLYAGDWKISAPELEDSSLILERKDSDSVTSGTILKENKQVSIKGDCSIQIHSARRGNEKLLNVYAELIEHGNDSSRV